MRCVNIDWLNVSFLEPLGHSRSADYFRMQGWEVVERAYGTPVFRSMFILRQGGLDLYEIRRDPYSKKGEGGIMNPRLCQIRLSNRSCYAEDPVMHLRKFAISYQYEYQGISRVDICLDFTAFDSSVVPEDFISMYMRGEISKLNQCNIACHGKDRWLGRCFNSLKWGSEHSLITTKLYNKSLELRESHDKPYIRDAWMDSQLDASRDVWRVEFSIKAESRHIISSDGHLMEISLTAIDTREKLLFIFFSLAMRYFHFKRVEYIGDRPKRKDRCADFDTFIYASDIVPYRPIHISTTQIPDRVDQMLWKRLCRYRDDAIWENGKDYDAIQKVLAYMRKRFAFGKSISMATAVQ